MEISSTNSPINDLLPISTIVSDSTWGDRLLLNFFSYSIILFPIAAIVFATKFKLFPSKIQNSLLIQWFVFGSDNSNKASKTKTGHDNKSLLPNPTHTITKQNQSIKSLDLNTRLTLIWCFFGLQVSYLIWGILQEKIMTTEYKVTSRTYFDRYNFGNKSSLLSTGQNKSKETLHLLAESDDKKTITFHDSQFLVFINRITAFILSIIALVYNRPKNNPFLYSRSTRIIQTQEENQKTRAPLYEYIYCSLSNILSSWCQYEALKYVNFPTQVLSKSCKIIPVMLMSKLMLKKRYQSFDYLCAILLSIGMFIFLLNQPVTNTKDNIITKSDHSKTFKDHVEKQSINVSNNGVTSDNKLIKIKELTKHVRNSSLISGLIILSLYLAFDSFTSNWQQSLFTRYCVTNWQMMAATNFYSILLTLTSLQQLGTLKPAFQLVASSKLLLFDCLLMSIMSSIGQLFVYYTIKKFGSVIFAVIMTLRQFLAILLSCAIYKHQLTLGSTAGLLLVFFVIAYQMYNKSNSSRKDTTITGNEKCKASVRYGDHQTQIEFNTMAVK